MFRAFYELKFGTNGWNIKKNLKEGLRISKCNICENSIKKTSVTSMLRVCQAGNLNLICVSQPISLFFIEKVKFLQNFGILYLENLESEVSMKQFPQERDHILVFIKVNRLQLPFFFRLMSEQASAAIFL